MTKRMAQVLLTLDTQGASLTDFAQPVCLHEALEVSVVRISISVQQITFPLCLVAARGCRPKEQLGLRDVPAWPLAQLPRALWECSVDMPSGTTVWPFADNPHITQEGFVLHGPTEEFRARVYRFLLNREIHCPISPCVREHLCQHSPMGS